MRLLVSLFGFGLVTSIAATGYLFGFDKTQAAGISSSLGVLPIWVGARYFLLDADAGPFVAGEVGLNVIRSGVSVDAAAAAAASAQFGGAAVAFPTTNDARVGFDVGAGWVLSKQLPIEVRAQLNCFNLLGQSDRETTLFGVGLSAGYTYRF